MLSAIPNSHVLNVERPSALEPLGGARGRHEDLLRDIIGERPARSESPPDKMRYARPMELDQARQRDVVPGDVIREQTLVVISQNRDSSALS